MDKGHIRQRNNGGFTLLELMIVIVILGILGAIVAPKFMDEPHKARVVQAKMQIENPVHGGQEILSRQRVLSVHGTGPRKPRHPPGYRQDAQELPCQRLHHQDPERPLGQ